MCSVTGIFSFTIILRGWEVGYQVHERPIEVIIGDPGSDEYRKPSRGSEQDKKEAVESLIRGCQGQMQ